MNQVHVVIGKRKPQSFASFHAAVSRIKFRIIVRRVAGLVEDEAVKACKVIFLTK